MFTILHRSSLLHIHKFAIPSSRPPRIGAFNGTRKLVQQTRTHKSMADGQTGQQRQSTIPPELYRSVRERVDQRRVDKERTRAKNHINNSVHMQVIGTASNGLAIPSLIVHSEGQSYLFNCSAGLQRTANSDYVKMTDLENIFITNDSWFNVDGAVSLTLTLQEMAAASLTIHGTEASKDIYAASFTFLQLFSGIECKTKDQFSGDQVDRGLRVHKIPLVPRTLDYSSEPLSKRCRIDRRLIAYLCSTPDLAPKLDSVKCRELGVPFGPLMGKLKGGQDIELPDGTIVKHSQVLGEVQYGDRFLVIECPTKDYIKYVIQNKELTEIGTDTEHPICVVAHFSPEEVTGDPSYQKWMESFPKGCRHLLLNHSAWNTPERIKSYRLLYLFNKIDSSLFPKLIWFDSLLDKMKEEVDLPPVECEIALEESKKYKCIEFEDLDRVIKVNHIDKLFLKPRRYLESAEYPLYLDFAYNQALQEADFLSSLATYQKRRDELPATKDCEPELIFLGTCSARPHVYRNTSGILLNLKHSNKSVILDCGEDTYGQLYRLYGKEKSDEILTNLKLIYISHQHADHHIGLLTILNRRRELTREKVVLVLPPSIDQFIDYHNKHYEDLSDSYTIFDSRAMKTKPVFGASPLAEVNDTKEKLYKSLDGLLEEISIVGVNHCFNACAVVMRFKIGHPEMKSFTLAYSGDCRPSDDLIAVGKDCDLLIHEGTFDHIQKHEALSKKHCSTAEAIEVGKKMRAKFTILTHFSGRIPKVPLLTEKFDDKVGVAQDNMVIRCPSQLRRLSLLTPLMRVIFRNHLAEVEKGYSKRKTVREIASRILD